MVLNRWVHRLRSRWAVESMPRRDKSYAYNARIFVERERIMSLRIVALALFTILFSSNVYAQCPGGYFRVGPLTTNRSIGANLASQVVATACINIVTTEELATINAVVIANLSQAQALADRIVANLGSVTKKCDGWGTLKNFELAILTASFESGWGTPHLTVTGTARACIATAFPVNFTLNMPVRFVVTPQKSIALEVDKPTTDLPRLIDAYVSSKIYQQAQAYTRVFRVSLPNLIPKEVFLFNPQLGDITASFGNDALSVRVSLTGQITSTSATKAINEKLQAGNDLHF
jgi:hypothetical protein